jgi:hypothetical protein
MTKSGSTVIWSLEIAFKNRYEKYVVAGLTAIFGGQNCFRRGLEW